MNLEQIQKVAQAMVEDDRERDTYFQKYQDAFHLKYDLPPGLMDIPYIHKVVTTDPYDAVSAATKVFSGLVPKIKYMPRANNELNKTRANEIERILKWQLMCADKRRSRPLVADILESSFLYSCVVTQVIDLDWQIKQIEAMGANSKRWKAARRYGRFMVVPYNPRHVHVRYSNMMPEAVVVCQVRSAQAVVDEFGTKGLKDIADKGLYVKYYEYMDYDQRAIWTEPDSGPSVTILEPTTHDLPFLGGWVAAMGGSGLEEKSEHAYKGLLYSIIRTDQWQTQNTVETLRVSLAIKDAGKPPLAEEGPNQDSATIDAMSPVGAVKVPVGNSLRALPPNQIDPALSVIADSLAGANSKTMVDRIIQGGGAGSEVSFAALNLATQTAVGQLKPGKELAEKVLTEMFTQMLLWVHYSGIKLDGYGTGEKDNGAMYTIEPDEVVPDNIYLTVELAPDLPTDHQQRANTAIMLHQAGLSSQEDAMEAIGVDDPELAQEKIMYEQLMQAEFQLVIQRKQAKLQMEIAGQQQEIANQQAMAQQQAEAEAMANQQDMTAGEGMMGAPAMGGQNAAMLNPNMTREQVTGMDAAGNELAGMGL